MKPRHYREACSSQQKKGSRQRKVGCRAAGRSVWSGSHAAVLFYHRLIESLRNLDATLRDARRRLGALGLAGRAWSLSVGRLVDFRVLFECELQTSLARLPEPSEISYGRVRIPEQPEVAAESARLLKVSLDQRSGQQLFVARDPAGRVVACTWNEQPEEGQARHRGIAVDRQWRGRGIAADLLLSQARELARQGVRVVLYRTSVGNRASIRMLLKAGASLAFIRVLTFVWGRCIAVTNLSGRWESLLRRRWERERDAVLARSWRARAASPARSGQIS